MNCPRSGHASRLADRPAQAGFTLLEICMVLLIIAILFGVTMPAIQSAFVENAVRQDSHELALMVKTAMIQSSEQHRSYVIDLTGTTMALHPAGATVPDTDTDAEAAVDKTDDATASANDDVEEQRTLTPPTQLLTPDPQKTNAWVLMPPTSWVFVPGELCPATHVRFVHNDAYLEMSFDALTGNMEKESTYFP
jgi:prepilin-type N-terminal cleavage/methylation domain-containing protein